MPSAVLEGLLYSIHVNEGNRPRSYARKKPVPLRDRFKLNQLLPR
jgi:hypothetical protein